MGQPAKQQDKRSEASVQKTLKETVEQAHAANSKSAKGGEAAIRLKEEADTQRQLDAQAKKYREMETALIAVKEQAKAEEHEDEAEAKDSAKLFSTSHEGVVTDRWQHITGKIQKLTLDGKNAARISEEKMGKVEKETKATISDLEDGEANSKQLGEGVEVMQLEKEGETTLRDDEAKAKYVEDTQRRLESESINFEVYLGTKIGKNSDRESDVNRPDPLHAHPVFHAPREPDPEEYMMRGINPMAGHGHGPGASMGPPMRL